MEALCFLNYLTIHVASSYKMSGIPHQITRDCHVVETVHFQGHLEGKGSLIHHLCVMDDFLRLVLKQSYHGVNICTVRTAKMI